MGAAIWFAPFGVFYDVEDAAALEPWRNFIVYAGSKDRDKENVKIIYRFFFFISSFECKHDHGSSY